MKWLALLLVLCVGCVEPLGPKPEPEPQPTPIVPEPKPEPVPAKTQRAEICKEIADQIDAGNIDTTDELVRVIQLLTDGGDWKKDDSDAVEEVLPGLVSAKRRLTAEDIKKLRSVK